MTPVNETNKKQKSVTKTFQKGDDFIDVVNFFTGHDMFIETHDYQPEGTCWSQGEPGPYDPRCELKYKYVITIRRIEP